MSRVLRKSVPCGTLVFPGAYYVYYLEIQVGYLLVYAGVFKLRRDLNRIALALYLGISVPSRERYPCT